MIIGVLSDTHNNIENTQKALEVFRREGIRRLFHCGDITRPDIIYLFTGFDVTFVQGNNDYWRNDLVEAMLVIGGQRTLPARWSGAVGGKRLAMAHGDSHGVLFDLTRSGQYDYVFHGHSHRRRDETIAGTRVINPGALGGKHDQSHSIAVVNLAAGTVEFVEIAP